MSEPRFDVAIVGAGAAGLMAAIFARRRARDAGREIRVVALDGAPRIGAKILISGGGRCNVTHRSVSADDFNGGSRNAVAKILRTFSAGQTVEFFRELGVTLKTEETGKLFPTTNRARTVLDALLQEAGEVRAAHRVSAVIDAGESFRLTTTSGELESRTVVLATGGRSVPRTGSDGFGYLLAESLGHSVTETLPALVPLLLDEPWLTALSGISLEGELQVISGDRKLLRRERGALLFTHFGISGPLALDISRHWIAHPGAELRLNILPGSEFAEVEAFLTSRPKAAIRTLLETRVPPRVAAGLLSRAGVDPEVRGGMLEREARRRLAHVLTSLPLAVTGSRGFDYAEVTAGGVPLQEIDPRTMASKRCRGLFLCGEILDVDGRIGGFNFQWAWATGRLAGLSAAEAAPSTPR